jgi:phage baseplate assembly protein W
MMNIDYPFSFDSRGRTAASDDARHIRNLIEQFLFTDAGERVNRPDFGSGLLDLVFEPGGEALAAATEQSVHGALQRWLGDRIVVEGVDVAARDGELAITVRYVVRRTEERRATTLTRGTP